MRGSCLVNFGEAMLNYLGVGVVPELVPEAHGDSPVRHGAVGIIGSDLLEFFLRFLVPEGVQQSDAALEGLLHRWRAGDGKDDGAELSGGQVFVVMVVFVIVSEDLRSRRGSETWGSRKSGQRRKDQQTDDAFHGNPAEKGV
jgi:hypothetical protein